MKLRYNFSYLALFFISFALLLIISCNPDHSRDNSGDDQEMQASKVSSESDAEAETIFNGLFDDAIGVNTEVGIGNTGIFGRGDVCPAVTVLHVNGNQGFPIRI